jgi:hypothetical protein
LIDPGAEQRGPARAGRGGDEGQLAVQTRVQPFDQAGTGDKFGSSGGI